jgi:proteic killer suppression protein
MAIQSFADKATEEFFIYGNVGKKAKWRNVANIARRKLDMIDYAADIRDLKSPPGNGLEALTRNLKGYHSIRINDQWRIVFKWTGQGPKEVRITDYHS